jgi:receptor expression-enhancing protein 1/2/3/4
MIGSLFSRFLCILVGQAFPLYKTFKAVRQMPQRMSLTEVIEGSAVIDLRRVVAFWTVLGVFMLFEFVIDFFAFILPMYYEIKTIFLLWLVHSNFSGAVFVFDSLLFDVLSSKDLDIDQSLQKSKTVIRKQLSEGLGTFIDAAAQAGINAIQQVFFIRKPCQEGK